MEMDNGELDIPSEQLLSCLDMTNLQSICSFDINEFLVHRQACNDALGRTEACADDLSPTQACAHGHACNQSGPDESHMHTCIHVPSQIMPNPNEFQAPNDDNAGLVEKKYEKWPLGNREAVCKYREKKASAASLEDKKAMNQQLMKRLQSQALLEAEVARLECLLVDIRGRIEGEIGSFPYHKPMKSGDVYQKIAHPDLPGTNVMNPSKVQCDD